MNWTRLIRRRFANSPAVIDGQSTFEVGNTNCFINLQSIPKNALILDVDVLTETDDTIRQSVHGEQHCDYVAAGCACSKPFLMLIEAKGNEEPKARRIRYAKRQTQNSETIARKMIENCRNVPTQFDVHRVVVTRHIPASRMTRWHNQQGQDDLFRDMTLVFSGDDIWRTIQGQ